MMLVGRRSALEDRVRIPDSGPRSCGWPGVCAVLIALFLSISANVATNDSFAFAVLGDNRGDSSGELSPAFIEVLQSIRAAAPAFVLNTGDMIYGHTSTAAARQQWRLYRDSVSTLGVPIHHVPGNHDLWDKPSAALFRELWGPASSSFDYGSARFIGLDTESNRGRLGREQSEWLSAQLAQADGKRVFLFLHRPLFPVDAGVESSLDVYPAERDQLHLLLVRHRQSIEAVFQGHEHLYHYEERDGVRYYTTGGGGANLYEPPELGGFHHFLLVRVTAGKVQVELKRVGAPSSGLGEPVKIAAGSRLESWEEGVLCYSWDYTVTTALTSRQATDGRQGLQLNFDLTQCPWPVLSLPISPAWGLRETDELLIDVYLPTELKGAFTITPAVDGRRKFAMPSSPLRSGWNTVRASLNEAGVSRQERPSINAVEWDLSAGTNKQCGSVIFDNFRLESAGRPGTRQPLESWEGALTWRVFNESVTASFEEQVRSQGKRGLKLGFDFATCRQPVALARLNPAWDLREPAALTVEVYVPKNPPRGLAVGLGIRAREVSHLSPPVPLRPGWNKVRVSLAAPWLPVEARTAAEQLEWRIYGSHPRGRGWVVLDDLRAE